ncbi:MAG: PEP-CTERM sorting domain-containing protein [Snowella sp.]|nr:PEP-CTERM sorting domain-containing protein [Snowella sp.]
MNFKSLAFGLALAGASVLGATQSAQAYQFNFLGTSDAGGGLTNYDFEFVTEGPSDALAVGQQLLISGFEGVTGLATSPVTDNVAGVLPSSFGFLTGGFTSTAATFVAQANVNLIPGNIRYQTFTVTAANTPGGIVTPFFPGPTNPLNPTPVPEPLTIMGSLAALGFGVYGKKFGNKQTEAKEAELV